MKKEKTDSEVLLDLNLAGAVPPDFMVSCIRQQGETELILRVAVLLAVQDQPYCPSTVLPEPALSDWLAIEA